MNSLVNSGSYFEKLYRSVSSLVRSLNYIDVDKRDCVNSLLNLARKMEVSRYIQQKNVIAISGMQGSGKTSLVKALYDLPQNLLPIGSARGERNPIFISERSDLKPGEYRAIEVYFDDFEKKEVGISPEDISSRSKQKNEVAYIELFVPRRYFTCENAGFVLLPGFEKNSQREFNSDYNSIMDYTLHFANAVILATDGAGIANEDIYVLIEKLGKNFNPSNCIFAITKNDTITDDDEKHEMRESLLEVCSECNISITDQQIVSTGVYSTPEENQKWIEQLINSINIDGVLNYNSAKRSFAYYRPMIDEMVYCADQIESALNLQKISVDTVGPIYEDLKVALQSAEENIEKELNKICISAQQKAVDEFVKESAFIPSKRLSTKKFLVINKKYHEIAEDKRVIAETCEKCLYDSETHTSVFISVAQEKIGGEDKRRKMIENVERALTIQGEVAKEQKSREQACLNEYVRYHLDSKVVAPPIAIEGAVPDTKAIAQSISDAFCVAFCSALTGRLDVETVGFRTTGIDAAINDVSNKKIPKNNMVTAMAILDMFDGKSDIVEAIVNLFVHGGGDAASTVLGVASIAVIVGMAAKKGIDIYNNKIEEQKLILSAWEHSLKNSISEQTNNCLDIFHEGTEKLLEYVQKIHRNRMHIGDVQMRLTAAQYAVADIRHLVNFINDDYADSLIN